MVETDAGLILRATVRAGGPGDGDRVVVVVRPERTRLVSATEGIVSGRLIEATIDADGAVGHAHGRRVLAGDGGFLRHLRQRRPGSQRRADQDPADQTHRADAV